MSSPKEISKRVAASKRRSRGVSDVYPPTTSDNAVLLLRRLWAPVLGVGVEESWREEEERKERLREREKDRKAVGTVGGKWLAGGGGGWEGREGEAYGRENKVNGRERETVTGDGLELSKQL